MGYEIKKMDNDYNHYKYHYLDHMCCVIDLRDNYWAFALDLFSINNFKLPINSLAGDLNIPFQQVEDIAFNLSSDQSYAKVGVEHNAKYSKIYSGYFEMDVSRNEYLKQDLNNVKLDMELALFIDPEAAKAAGSAISQESLDALIDETLEQRWSFEMYYTNTHYINNNGLIDNPYSFKLPFGHTCFPLIKEVEVTSDNLYNLTSPINSLVTIMSNTPFQVLGAKVKFYYWIELSTEPKTLEKVLNIKKDLCKEIHICLDDFTIFDYEKNEVSFNPIGAKGFYIPIYSQGYYEVELQILQNSCLNKFVLRNDFNFTTNTGKPVVGITHRLINDISDFKEVIF